MTINTVNFFDEKYIVQDKITAEIFGIQDDYKNKAYTTLEDIENCNAIVENNQSEIQFVPVDHNMDLIRSNDEHAKRCDGMLYYPNCKEDMIIFIELKSGKNHRNWKPDAKRQLEETISFFNKTNDYNSFKKKYAFICNNTASTPRPNSTEMLKFKDETHFELRVMYRIDLQKL